MARLPFDRSLVFQVFGHRNLSYDPYHKGVDFGRGIANSPGTAVPAAADGVVSEITYGYRRQYQVEIDHGADSNGVRWKTRYHMLQEGGRPEVGQNIKEGQSIGRIQVAGPWAEGVHLHFEVHNLSQWTSAYGYAVDPLTNINKVPSGSGGGNEDDVPTGRMEDSRTKKLTLKKGKTIIPLNDTVNTPTSVFAPGRKIYADVETELAFAELDNGKELHARFVLTDGNSTDVAASYGIEEIIGTGGNSYQKVHARGIVANGQRLRLQIETFQDGVVYLHSKTRAHYWNA